MTDEPQVTGWDPVAEARARQLQSELAPPNPDARHRVVVSLVLDMHPDLLPLGPEHRGEQDALRFGEANQVEIHWLREMLCTNRYQVSVVMASAMSTGLDRE